MTTAAAPTMTTTGWRRTTAAFGAACLVVGIVLAAQAAERTADELFSREEPWKFWLTLGLLALLGGAGKVGMTWTAERPIQHQLGQLALSIVAAMGVAFFGWTRYDATTTMAAAVFAAPLFDIIFDIVSRQLRALPTPPQPPKRGEP